MLCMHLSHHMHLTGDGCFLEGMDASQRRSLPPSRDHMQPKADLCFPEEASQRRSLPPSRDHMQPRADLCLPKEISASEHRSAPEQRSHAAQSRSVLPGRDISWSWMLPRGDLCFPEEIPASEQRSHAAQSRSVLPRGDISCS